MLLTCEDLKNVEEKEVAHVFYLIQAMLNIKPDQRPSASFILKHPYFALTRARDSQSAGKPLLFTQLLVNM